MSARIGDGIRITGAEPEASSDLEEMLMERPFGSWLLSP
jgi:hypothetical protein